MVLLNARARQGLPPDRELEHAATACALKIGQMAEEARSNRSANAAGGDVGGPAAKAKADTGGKPPKAKTAKADKAGKPANASEKFDKANVPFAKRLRRQEQDPSMTSKPSGSAASSLPAMLQPSGSAAMPGSVADVVIQDSDDINMAGGS